MKEEELLQLLRKAFPDGLVYSDAFWRKNSKGIDAAGRGKGFAFFVRRYSREQGLTREDWLERHGFAWKETGYVEPDMKEWEAERGGDGAFDTADYVLRAFPLAGEYIPTATEARRLYEDASGIVRGILSEERPLKKRDCVVLTLETVLLLKDWPGFNNGEDRFWGYVFRQYGFKADGRPKAEERLCAQFRSAIQYTFTHYRRFLAPRSKQRYYTTLMLHALSPRQSIEALFNILFDFYARTLEFQYVAEDISYKVFTKGMLARWDGRVKTEESLRLRSDTVFSGLQTLFEERPCYMANLCDTIVRKMDALLRGDGRAELHEDRNDWDRLLLEWYKNKSSAERSQLKGERRGRKAEYIASSRDRIYVQYAMSESMVGLEVPRIRLPEVRNELPTVTIRQGDRQVFQRELSVTGNDLCLTTRCSFLPLRDMSWDFDAPLTPRAEIQYCGDVLYDSGNRLFRACLLFDCEGKERRAKTGTTWLFAGNGQHLEFPDESGVYQELHPGQLYRLHLGEVSSVAVDGEELFADKKTAAGFRCHTSVKRCVSVWAVDQGRTCELFPEPFSMTLCIPEQEQPLRYRVLLDGQTMEEFHVKDKTFWIQPPCEAGVPHRVQAMDLVSGRICFEYRYMVLPEFTMRLNEPLYREGADEALLRFFWQGHDTELSVPAPAEGNTAEISLPGLALPLEAELPVVHCSLLGRSAFAAPDAVWHRDVPPDEFVELRLPDGWIGYLMLGVKPIPADQTGRRYEIGNALRSGTKRGDREPLWLSLQNDRGEARQYKLTEVIFSPCFLKEPAEAPERSLCWRFAGNFFGDRDPRFSIVCAGPDGMEHRYAAGAEDAVLAEAGELPDGRYACRVYLKSRSVFTAGKDELIYDGSFILGDPLEYQMEGKELHLNGALCWDIEKETLKNEAVLPGGGILCDLVYQKTDTPSGEALPMPLYEATLYYSDTNGVRHPFNSRKNNLYEEVNPVRVWIVNEHLLILQCATKDGVMLDNQRSTLVNRRPETYLSRKEEYQRVETPDYYLYESKGGIARV